MINGKILTAAFLLNRKWPLSQLQDGTASRTLLRALNLLTPAEARVVLSYEDHGTFLLEDQR